MIWLPLVLVLCASTAASLRAAEGSKAQSGQPENPHLTRFLAEAESRRLWERPAWLRRLHFREGWLWGGQSEIADPAFFLAPNGRSNPRAELEATLRAFFAFRVVENRQQPAQCRFISRFRWLQQELSMEPAHLPEQPCPDYEAWRKKYPIQAISLVFASHNLNDLGSMFGHPMLRLYLGPRSTPQGSNRQESTENEAGDVSLSFAAGVPEDVGFLTYVVGGIGGGFPGEFSIRGWAYHAWLYNEVEDRELWEYRLAMTPEQITWFADHLYELGDARFLYYFFRENCAYQILPLLEVGRPDISLSTQFHFWTLPGDLMRSAAESPGLVSEVIYYPSRRKRLQLKLAMMAPEAEEWVYPLAEDSTLAEAGGFQILPPTEQSLALAAAQDVISWRSLHQRTNQDELKQRLRELRLHQEKLTVALPTPPDAMIPKRAEQGHRTSRAGMGAGTTLDGSTFQTATVQASYHNLLSLDWGFAPNTQLAALRLDLRRDEGAEGEPAVTRLERFALAEVIAMFPLTRLVRQPSWKFHLGWQRDREGGCQDCTPFQLGGGMGVAAETSMGLREIYYSWLELAGAFHGDYPGGHRLGAGLSMGMLVDLANAWRMEISGSSWRYTTDTVDKPPGTPRKPLETVTLRQRFSLGVNGELLLDALWRQGERETMATLGFYF